MKNFFILKGTEKTFYKDTFDKVRKALTESGKSVFTPTLPTTQGLSYSAWEQVLKGFLDAKIINPDTTFICHDIASVFLVKFVLTHKIKIKRAILIDGFYAPTGDSNIDSMYADFFQIDPRGFKEFCNERICLYNLGGKKTVSLSSLKTFSDFIYASGLFVQGTNADIVNSVYEQVMLYARKK